MEFAYLHCGRYACSRDLEDLCLSNDVRDCDWKVLSSAAAISDNMKISGIIVCVVCGVRICV